MRTDPELTEILFGDRGMFRGIKVCLEGECLVSALTLAYSCIDSLAALTRDDPTKDSTSVEFRQWVDTYVHPASFNCTSMDIYAARCGIVHTYGQDSSKRRKGKARSLVYEWRTGPSAAAEIPLPSDALVIVVEDLIEALERAVTKFPKAIETDVDLSARVNRNLSELLCYRPSTNVTVFVAA